MAGQADADKRTLEEGGEWRLVEPWLDPVYRIPRPEGAKSKLVFDSLFVSPIDIVATISVNALLPSSLSDEYGERRFFNLSDLRFFLGLAFLGNVRFVPIHLAAWTVRNLHYSSLEAFTYSMFLHYSTSIVLSAIMVRRPRLRYAVPSAAEFPGRPMIPADDR